MQERFAFTARPWGHGAVVCRAVENRPGPIVVQEFGQFDTWTQANAFARRLNEGLEIDLAEAEYIVTSSTLQADNLIALIGSPLRTSIRPYARVLGSSIQVQFEIAELDLALTFCRLLREKPTPHADRLLRNARKALFNAMHFLLYSQAPASDVQEITTRMWRLQEELHEISPLQQELVLAGNDCAEASLSDSPVQPGFRRSEF